MAKITITFQEEGQQPTIVEIPAEIAAVLDAHAAALEEATGRPVGGKTGLFAKMTWENWLKPILSMRGHDVISLAGATGQAALQARQQARQAEALAEMAAMAAVIQIKGSVDEMQQSDPQD
jgi:hypothetical protein